MSDTFTNNNLDTTIITNKQKYVINTMEHLVWGIELNIILNLDVRI
jgi:hypothetical protein